MQWIPEWSDVWTRLSYPQTFWFLASLTVGMLLLSWLVRSRMTLAFDLRTTKWLQIHHHPIVNSIARWLTWSGNSLTIVMLAVGVFVVCLIAETPKAGAFVLVSLVALPLNAILKNVFDRERPGEHEVRVSPGPRWGFSYPSGHAMGSTAFYSSVGFLFWVLVPNSVVRYSLVSLFFAMPILVSLSRVYLGAHWVSDVVGGMAGGLVVTVILAAMYPV